GQASWSREGAHGPWPSVSSVRASDGVIAVHGGDRHRPRHGAWSVQGHDDTCKGIVRTMGVSGDHHPRWTLCAPMLLRDVPHAGSGWGAAPAWHRHLTAAGHSPAGHHRDTLRLASLGYPLSSKRLDTTSRAVYALPVRRH